MAYKVVIGLEVHCELKTNAKVFSGGKNGYSLDANSNISAVDMAFPGIMPYPNQKAVESALKTAIALDCANPDEVLFDRKNYFYPDLPKGFQITQVTKPMGINGHLIIDVDGVEKNVLIHQLHLEEDTASLDHYSNYSLIDYNRSGIPLIEIVTEPCLHSTKEALTFLEELRSIFIYCGVSDAASDKGQMRCDVNVSLMKEEATTLGTKVEIKNINSFNNVKQTIEYEIKRQTQILDDGGSIVMETRRYDDEDAKTYSMRKKVEAVDYKYFIEPNIIPVKITKDYLAQIKSTIPMLPSERRKLYIESYGLSKYDANILVKDQKVALYFEKMLSLGADPKISSNWVTTKVLGYTNKYEISIDEIYLIPEMLCELIDIQSKGSISSVQAREVFYECLTSKREPKEVVKSLGLTQNSDDSSIRNIIIEVLNEQEENIKIYKAGKDNVLDFLIGQVMKKSKGQANPSMVATIIKEEIDKR